MSTDPKKNDEIRDKDIENVSGGGGRIDDRIDEQSPVLTDNPYPEQRGR